MTHPLRAIIAAVAARRAERPVLIFDLDGTLYDNRPRTLRIAHAYAAGLGEGYAQDAHTILGLSAHDLHYRLDDTLRAHGVSEEVVKGTTARWFARFFTDQACADDVPVRGSVRFVRACYELGATIVYLTGRDVPNMLVGTVRTLRDDGFPVGVPRVELVLKPRFEDDDTTFKIAVLDAMAELGTVLATFENEPGNANMFLTRWPKATTVLVETLHAPGAPESFPEVVKVADFSFE